MTDTVEIPLTFEIPLASELSLRDLSSESFAPLLRQTVRLVGAGDLQLDAELVEVRNGHSIGPNAVNLREQPFSLLFLCAVQTNFDISGTFILDRPEIPPIPIFMNRIQQPLDRAPGVYLQACFS